GPNPTIGDSHGVDESAALVTDVDRRLAVHAELVAQKASATRELKIGAERRKHDGVDFARFDAGVLHRRLARGHGQVGRTDAALFDESTLFDARALIDPLVAGGHDLREIVVGDDAARYVAADAENRGAGHG